MKTVETDRSKFQQMRNRLDLVFAQNFKPQTTVSLEIHKGIGSGGASCSKTLFRLSQ